MATNCLSIPPQYCLVIEDTPVGITTAKNAGMTVIGITTSHEKLTLYQADFMADTYDEISNWISN